MHWFTLRAFRYCYKERNSPPFPPDTLERWISTLKRWIPALDKFLFLVAGLKYRIKWHSLTCKLLSAGSLGYNHWSMQSSPTFIKSCIRGLICWYLVELHRIKAPKTQFLWPLMYDGLNWSRTGGSDLLLLVAYYKWPLMSDRHGADLFTAHGSASAYKTHTFIIGHKNLTPQTKSYILPNSSSPTTIPLHLISIVDINPYLHPISWSYHLLPLPYPFFHWPKDGRASDLFIVIKYLPLSHHMK